MKHSNWGVVVMLAATACGGSGGDATSDSNSGFSAGP